MEDLESSSEIASSEPESVADQRLNQARWIRGCSLVCREYRSRPDWKDDHCTACWAQFSETPGSSILSEGFATYTRWDWLCGNCFEELREPLNLRLAPATLANQLSTGTLDILHGHGQSFLPDVRQLFLEYGESLGMQVCFESFSREVEGLPGEYSRSTGTGSLLVALFEGRLAGCVAVRQWQGEIAEMKRLYVRPECRGAGVGEALTRAILDEARRLGYRAIRLDTLASMKSAHKLYQALGFRRIPPYGAKPIAEALHMELTLD